jgi:hypothetical protein
LGIATQLGIGEKGYRLLYSCTHIDQGQWHFRKDGLLYHLQRLYVPDDEAVQSKLFACFHENPLAGHFGKKRTLKLIQRHYH